MFLLHFIDIPMFNVNYLAIYQVQTHVGAIRKSLYGFASIWVISSRTDAQTICIMTLLCLQYYCYFPIPAMKAEPRCGIFKIGTLPEVQKLPKEDTAQFFIAADDNFKICRFLKNNKSGMIFHENRLLADDSHEISYLIFSKIGKDVAKFVVSCSCDWRSKG